MTLEGPPPAVSLVILTHRRARLLRRCLASLPKEAPGYEGLLLVNGEGQGERRWHAVAARRWPWLRVLAIPAQPRGAARNRAIRETRGELLFFIDDDTILPPGFLTRLTQTLGRHPDAPGFGGPNLAAPLSSPFQRAVDFLLRSPFGAGPMRVRYQGLGSERRVPAWALMLCNLGVRREAFEAHGLRFPDRCASAEENLLLSRLERRLGRPVYSPGLFVWHERRPDWAGFAEQVYRSGLGRAQITRLDPGSLQLSVLGPAAFWLYSASLPWTASRWPLTLLPAAAYAAATLVETLRLSWKDPAAAAWLPALLPSGHLCYACGMAWGLAQWLRGSPSAAALAGEACATR